MKKNYIIIVNALILLLTLTSALHQHALSTSTIQNGQEVLIGQSIFDIVKNPSSFSTFTISPPIPTLGSPIQVSGELRTQIVGLSGIIPTPTLSNEKVDIYLVNNTNFTIISNHTATTDSFGTFRQIIELPIPDVSTISIPPLYWVVVSFDGNTDTHPSVAWSAIYPPPGICPPGLFLDPGSGFCRIIPSLPSGNQTNSTQG